MKNHYRLTTVAAISLALATAFLSGCKKDDTITTATGMPSATELAQGEATLAKIMDFKQQVDYYRAYPNVKDGTSVSIAEAIWNIEALFNLTYAYPDLSYGRTVTADTLLYLPLQSDNTILLTDLTVFYGQMYEVVRDIYHSINLDSKQFLILDVEEGQPEGSRLPINLHSVQGTVKGMPPTPPAPPQPWRGPFTGGPSWYYGENGGNDLGIEPTDIDAADTLQRMLYALLVPKAPVNYDYFYTDPIIKQSDDPRNHTFSHEWFPNIGDSYCEFYRANPAPEDLWLNEDLMNFHYYGERHFVLEILPYQVGMPIPSDHILFEIHIEEQSYNSSKYHKTSACYGFRNVIGHGVIVRGNL